MFRPKRNSRWILTALGALAAAASAFGARAAPADPPGGQDALLVTVTVNGVPRDGFFLVYADAERLLVDPATLAEWSGGGVGAAGGAATAWIDLRSAPSVRRVALDENALALEVDFVAEALPSATVSLASGPGKLEPAEPCCTAATLDYAANLSIVDGALTPSGRVQFGLSPGPHAPGFGAVEMVAAPRATADGDSEVRPVRLDAFWQVDLPKYASHIRFGDSASRNLGLPGGWRYAGLQVARDIATDPDFTFRPQLAFDGETFLPTEAELIVDRATRGRFDLPPGPFSIQEIDVSRNRGEAILLLRDPSGREQAINIDYYTAPKLLGKGKFDYSFDLGVIRDNYGRVSGDYAGLAASSVMRYGVSRRLTLGVQAQASAEGGAGFGGEAVWASPFGNFTAAAVYGGRLDKGWSASSSYFFGGGDWSVAAFGRLASPDWVPVEVDPGLRSLANEVGVSVSVSPPWFGGSARFSWRRRSDYLFDDPLVREASDRARFGNLGAALILPLPKIGQLNVSVNRQIGDTEITTAAASLNVPLGGRMVTGGRYQGATQPDGGFENAFEGFVERRAPIEAGVGWRLDVRDTGDARFAARLQRPRFEAAALVSGGPGGNVAAAASLTGALMASRFGVLASRRLGEAFALVESGEVEGVPVRASNQAWTVTDGEGRALLTGLRAYDRNRLRLDTAAIPFDVEVVSAEVEVAPPRRGLVKVSLPVRRLREFSFFSVVVPGEDPPPSGARVETESGEDVGFVGFGGLVYMPNRPDADVFTVKLEDGSCRIDAGRADDPEAQTAEGAAPCVRTEPPARDPFALRP